MKTLIDVLFYLAVCSTVIALVLRSWSAFAVLGMASVLVGIALSRQPGSKLDCRKRRGVARR